MATAFEKSGTVHASQRTTVRTTIEPKRGWQPIELAELWRFRELIWFLSWRDIKVRYKQTVLGATWAIIQPVMTMIVFTVFFGRLGGMDRNTSTEYPIFVYAGLLPWQFFSSAVTQSGQSLVASANLISKVYFPRLIVPIAAVASGLVDFAISSVVMIVLMVYYQVPVGINVLILPLLIVGIVVAAVGIGSWLSAMTIAYRDFRYVVPFVVQIWLFASPVAYPLTVIPPEWRLLYCLNPMAGLIAGFRSALLKEPMYWDCVSVSIVVSLVLLVMGTLYFRRTERRFADIV